MSDGVATYQIEDDIAGLVRHQLADATRQGSEAPFLHLESRAVYRFQIESVIDGHRFLADEPVRGGGTDVAPAPLRYFLAGVVQCIQVWCIKMAAVAQVPLTGLAASAGASLERGRVEAETGPLTRGDLVAGRGFREISVVLRIDTEGDVPDSEVLDVAQAAVERCPAAVSIARASTLKVEVVHNGISLGLTG